ncbi:hypothetical protein CAQU_12535 [Corynebacterium aquilae DSM 44791]|uniref:VanZ-like domain-containing protein n=1 Tax=Corynebacterium aquilae DSM 44791 TaxID=1431546 RepID=A0A1L7CIW4_9CORY|nr:hypothetical protein CAQU_12535 [Corynebacterium aquilae DSM 44791]
MLGIALSCWSLVVVALTMLKAFYQIGYLWKPQAHHHRGLYPIPFSQFFRSQTLFGPLFDAFGNVILFLPIGFLLALLWRGAPRLLRSVTIAGFFGSLTIEIMQYIFRLGYSDIDDLILNTAGAALGGLAATKLPKWSHTPVVWLILLACISFAILVALGPRLGDPAKVVG